MRLSIFDHVLTPAEAAAAPTAPVDPTAPDVSFLAREPAAALESFFGTINRITTDNPVSVPRLMPHAAAVSSSSRVPAMLIRRISVATSAPLATLTLNARCRSV